MALNGDFKKLLAELEAYASEYKGKKHQDGDKDCELIYQGKAEAYAHAAKRLKGVMNWNEGEEKSVEEVDKPLYLKGRKVRIVEDDGVFDIQVLVPASKDKFLCWTFEYDERWCSISTQGEIYFGETNYKMPSFKTLEAATDKVKSLIRGTVYHYLKEEKQNDNGATN